VSSIVIELLVLTGYVTIAARARRMMRRPALARSLQRAGGALLIGAGARLAAIGRP
jgi:threonine/homoserine/homoserine lactone efflux protein